MATKHSRVPNSQPPTPEEREARERLNAHPGRWRAPKAPLEAAHYTLDVEVNPAQADALRKATADLALYRGGGRTSLRVVHGRGWARIELGEGMLGAGSAVVRAPGGAALFLDLRGRTFLHLTEAQLPNWRDRPIERIRVGKKGAGEPDSARPRFEIAADGLRAELELDPDARLRAFAGEALSTVLGIRADDRPELQQLHREGFPVSGSTWIAGDATCNPTLRWSVRDVRIERVDPALFEVPADWTDMRDVEALAKLAPQGGYTMDLKPVIRPDFDRPINDSWLEPQSELEPVLTGPVGGVNQDAIGTCIDSRYGNGAGLHVAQLALDDVRTLVNLALQRVSYFQGESGVINVDWLKQFREYSDALKDSDGVYYGDGVYHLLRWPPTPGELWPPLPTDSPETQKNKKINRFGGLGLLDRIAERGARRILADGQHAQLGLPPALLTACDAVVADGSIAVADRFDRLPIEDQALLREIYAEGRIGRLELPYKTEGKIQELPKGDAFPADLVRYKLFDLSLEIELHPTGIDVKERGEVLQELKITGPNSIGGTLKLFRINGSAIVLRWPGLAYAAFGAGAAIACFFVPAACPVLTTIAAVGAWLILDAASVAVTTRNPRIEFSVSWIQDPAKNDNLLYPTVQTKITTSSRTVVYVSAVPDGLHYIIGAVLTLALSFSNEVEDAIADEIKDQLQEALRDDVKLTYPPGQGGLAQAVESAGAFPDSPPRIGLGAHYRRPDDPVLPYPWATQVDVLNAAFVRMMGLDALYGQAFPPPANAKVPRSRPYAVFSWSVNLLNAYLWTLWKERRFDMMVPADPIGSALAATIGAAFPGMAPHRDKMRLLSASPPRLELTPWTHAGGLLAQPGPAASFGESYARVSFDDVRLCAPLEGSDAVLELAFPAAAIADVVLGTVRGDGSLDLFGSPETAFDILFDVPSVAVGPWWTAGVRLKDGPTVTPLPIDDLQKALVEAVRAMFASRPSSAIARIEFDARNVQRYGLGAFALTAVMVPVGGYLYAYLGLPRLTIEGIGPKEDPVGWLEDRSTIPENREVAQKLLVKVNTFS